jgi:hypothetical protein
MATPEAQKPTDLQPQFETLAKEAVKRGKRIDLVNVKINRLVGTKTVTSPVGNYSPEILFSDLNKFVDKNTLITLSQLEKKAEHDLQPKKESYRQIKYGEEPDRSKTFFVGVELILDKNGIAPVNQNYYVRGESKGFLSFLKK